MSDMRAQLVETAASLLTAEPTLAAFEAAGFGQLLVAEADGGFGGDWGDAEAVLRLVGYHAPGLEVADLIVGPAAGDPHMKSALASVAVMGGALERCLELSIDHANTRVQFGKPLGKQQAVQQNLAILAEETAAVAVAAQAAAKAMDHGDADFEVGCAKLRANQAAGRGAAIAHQVHGAIGFTQEYPLHHYTRALATLRSHAGNDAHWADRIGAAALQSGGRGLWIDLTRRSDARLATITAA
ncbi:MAG: acyl-CoA dehydrogenase family protein [Chakrabartia godavariana]